MISNVRNISKIIYFLPFLLICLLLFSGCWGDRHPNYPFAFANGVNTKYVKAGNTEKELSECIPVIVKGKNLYLKDTCLYDIQGSLVRISGFNRLFPDRRINFTGERTFSGYYIFKVNKDRYENFYLFDFDDDRLIGDIMAVDFRDYMMEELSEELMQRLDSLQMQLPEVPVMEGHWIYASPREEDKEKFNKVVRSNYEKAIKAFISQNKKEVFSYSSDKGKTYLVFPQKGIAFESETGGLSSFAEYPEQKFNKENPLISIYQTGSAFLGYGIRFDYRLPVPENNGYVYYFKLVCENEKFNFSSFRKEYFLYDYELTDEKIYFSVSSRPDFTNLTVYEYNRKRKN